MPIPSVPSDSTARTSHTNYLFDLKKLIEKSRENIKEVNEKIKEQAVLKRNQKREERSRQYYEKGVELTNEGKLDEAREYFEKAIAITDHPEMAGYIKESQRRLKKQEDALHSQERQHFNQIKQEERARREDVEQAYKEAVALYKDKKYHPAKDAFEHVDEIAPDYRATDSYLRILDQDINMEDIQAAKKQAVEIARQQKEAEAARAKEKQMWLKQIEQKEKERKESIDKQAGDVYDEAVELFKNRKFAEAKKKFEEVSWVIPDYKETIKYLERIDRDAKDEQERITQEQKKALQQQRWQEEVEGRQKEAQRLHELEVQKNQHNKDLQDQAQFLYTLAVALFDKKDWQKACDQFISIEKLVPDFKDTRLYLEKLKSYITVPMLPLQPPVVTQSPTQEGLALSLDDQKKQAQEIAALADRSAQLFRQVSVISDGSSIEQMKRKMARVDETLINLKDSKERQVHQMYEEASRLKLAENRSEIEDVTSRGRNCSVPMIMRTPKADFWHWRVLCLIIGPRVVILRGSKRIKIRASRSMLTVKIPAHHVRRNY